MRYLVLGSALLTFAFCSCTTTNTVTCQPGQLMIYGIGFASSDFDNGNSTITRYKADGLFDSLIGTSGVYVYGGNGDTLILETSIVAGYDYLLSIPSDSVEYRITDITLDGLYKETFTHTSNLFGNYHNDYCVNGIRSCSIDGIVNYPTPAQNYYGNAVYIKK